METMYTKPDVAFIELVAAWRDLRTLADRKSCSVRNLAEDSIA